MKCWITSVPSFHFYEIIVIQVLVEIIDGDLEQGKWNILLKYLFLFIALENTEKCDEENKIHPNMYRTSLEENK